MTKKFLAARKMLLKACDGYIQHNQMELDGFKAHSPYIPAYAFFDDVLNKYEPDPGFKDWIFCYYYDVLQCISVSFHITSNPFEYFECADYPFEEIKWWFSAYEDSDQTAPETVLHNLNAMLNLLNFHMGSDLLLAQKKIELQSDENDLKSLCGTPLSIQIYKTLENFKLRARFAQSIMQKTTRRLDISDLCRAQEEATPFFEGYLKGVAVKELKATLENPDLDDNAAVKAVEEQLKNGVTIELLKKNRQSQQEKDLKFLSLISICIGIGIFTTLGLVFKRLYDSGGTSINFFKPLSQNLYETIGCITTGLENDSELSSSSRLL